MIIFLSTILISSSTGYLYISYQTYTQNAREILLKTSHKSIDNTGYQCYNNIIKRGKEEMQMDKKISKLVKIVRSLTQLALEIGTLIAVIKMIIESIQ